MDGKVYGREIVCIIIYQHPEQQLNPYGVKYSIEPSPSWEANRFSTSQEFSRMLS